MKKYLTTAALGILIAFPAMSLAAEPKTFEEKLSYSMGYEVGNYFKNAGGDIQKGLLISGIEDAFQGTTPAMTKEEMVAVQKEFAAKMQALQQEQLEEMKTKNLAEGQAFLDKNKETEGVIITESGLQYQVLTAGEGENAKLSDTVKVHYEGAFVDGTVFDSSIKRGEPVEFSVDQVIKGWSEALQLMNVGSKLKLVVPADLAYGEQGAPQRIPPNSVLVFEVELISIVTKE